MSFGHDVLAASGTKDSAAAVMSSGRTPKTPNRGQYGCVYHPSLVLDAKGKLRTASSSDSEAQDFVTKLQYDSAAARSEVVIGALVAPLLQEKKKKKKTSAKTKSSLFTDDNDATNDMAAAAAAAAIQHQSVPRFSPVIESFVVEKGNITDKVLEKCAVITTPTMSPPHGSNGGNQFLVTKMRLAGKETMTKSLHDFTGAKHASLQSIWDELMISLDQLVSVGVVHCDLKGDNILNGRGAGRSIAAGFAPTIIDFGLSIHAPSLLDKSVSSAVAAERWRAAFPMLTTFYVVWCPEIAICAALWQFSPLDDGDDNVNLDFGPDGGDISLTEESYMRHYDMAGQPLSPDEHINERTLNRLHAVVAACFRNHPALIHAAKFMSLDALQEKRTRLDELVDAAVDLGRTRLGAARYVLEQTWHTWDRFSVAAAFLAYRPNKKSQLTKYIEDYKHELVHTGHSGSQAKTEVHELWSTVDETLLA